MSTINDEDCENIFARDSSSSENEMEVTNVESRPMARKSLPLRTLNMNNWAHANLKQIPILVKACKPNDKNSTVKVLSLPLPQNSIDLEKSPGPNVANSSIKIINMPLSKNKIDLEKSPGIKRKSKFIKIISGRTDIQRDSAGRQMFKLNTISNTQTVSSSRKIASLFDEITAFESEEEDCLTPSIKVPLFNDSDQENERSIFNIADEENHLKNTKMSAEKSKTSSKKDDEATSNINIKEKLVLIKDQKLPPQNIESEVTKKRKYKPWDQVSFLVGQNQNVFISADDLIQISGIVDLVPEINHLDLSGKISDHFKFSVWRISHLSLVAASQVLHNPENRPRTPNNIILNQLLEEASYVKVESIGMENCTLDNDSEDHAEAITESKLPTMNTKLGHHVSVTPRRQKDSWELSSPEFGKLFGLRLKSVAEMKTGFVGHQVRRLRKRPNKYSPS